MKATGYNSVNSWIATFSCAVVGFLGIVPMRLSGFFFIIILDQLQTSRKIAAIPIVVYTTIRTLGGPLTGYLGEIFGLRIIICIGSALSALGVGCCFFANDVVAITIYLGVIYGTGLAFTNSLVHSVIRQHFNRNINLANGLYLTGSCIGATVFTPVIKYLMNTYGISGMFLILSGILLHAVPASIILKNPKNEVTDCEATPQMFQDVNYEKVELSERSKYTNKTSKLEDCEHNLCDGVDQTAKNLKHLEEEKDNNFKALDPDLHIYPGSVDNNVTRQCFKENNPNANIVESDERSKTKLCCSNFQLFLDTTFLLQMCLQSIDGFVTVLNWTVIVDFGRDKGIAIEWGYYFVMFLPLSEMIGNATLNWLTDRGFISRKNFCIICFFLKAITSVVIMLAQSFSLVMIGILIFGYLSGALTSTFPGFIMEFIDKDKHNMALASRYTLYGVFGLLKSLLIGFFRETLGSYDGIYYFIIVSYMFCILFSILTPISASRKRKKKTLPFTTALIEKLKAKQPKPEKFFVVITSLSMHDAINEFKEILAHIRKTFLF